MVASDELFERNDVVTTTIILNGVNEIMKILPRSKQEEQNKCSAMAMHGKCIPREFLWNINNWSDNVNMLHYWVPKEIFSNQFFSHENGYKMCLSMHITGGFFSWDIFVHIHWFLMPGPFDSDLQWPFKHSVTIDIINPQTGLSCKGRTQKIGNDPNNPGWQMPSKDKNIRIYFLAITSNEISTMITGRKNDQLLIKCTIHPVSD